MGIRKCVECRIRKQDECKWVNGRNMQEIGRCVTDPNWGGACATCGKGKGNGPGEIYAGVMNKTCKVCLDNTRIGTRYFRTWSKRK